MNLSYRLKTVASFVPEGSIVADIGTDHGYIPIYLAEQGKITHAVAMDVRTGPLERAEEHIRSHGLKNVIETRLSDGLRELRPGEADTAVIAGMGGELMIRILSEGRHMWPTVKRWILSPQSDLHKVRIYLRENGFPIEKETMILDEGKYYTVMAAGRRAEALRNCTGEKTIYDFYGKCLIQDRNQVLSGYLEWERGQKEKLLEELQSGGAQMTERAVLRIRSLEEELKRIKEAQDEMQ
ncbi:class I SAM-dependent methyltransferase [Clostridium sp. AM58-1XD]|uniref:tRNA (adenine(22)-N(1))-methyltransferase n=1 Tax=Clostridium sp. AM58-1XD TaxID=2292307 RepID=UPI000E4AE0CC|nr:class I SAM-dependent methyltransferase [Clostridium sp. AM58-1XD]RGZ00632.1 SAM-dependent methyltransferase [Clostridium sp. AM58-1XD]